MSGLTPDRSSFPFARHSTPHNAHHGRSHFSFSSKGSCIETIETRPLTPHRPAPHAPTGTGPVPVRTHERAPSFAARQAYTRTNTDDSMRTIDTREANQRLYDRRLRDGGMIPLQLVPQQPVPPPLEPETRPRPSRLSQITASPLATVAFTALGGGCFVLACLTVANTVQLHQFGQALANGTLSGIFKGNGDHLPVYR